MGFAVYCALLCVLGLVQKCKMMTKKNTNLQSNLKEKPYFFNQATTSFHVKFNPCSCFQIVASDDFCFCNNLGNILQLNRKLPSPATELRFYSSTVLQHR